MGVLHVQTDADVSEIQGLEHNAIEIVVKVWIRIDVAPIFADGLLNIKITTLPLEVVDRSLQQSFII